MKLLIISDAWFPQVNGVVRTLSQMKLGLEARGWTVEVLGPQGATVGCPTYPEIRLTLNPTRHIEALLNRFVPDAIHIATEGPLGRAMRAMCLDRRWRFTTSFHTRFPEYLKFRFGIPRRWTYFYMRGFHGAAEKVLVPTPSMRRELEQRGFKNVEIWGRGVDTDCFTPHKRKKLPFPGPIQLYVGRLAVEKNLHAFLSINNEGTKVVVGDGPDCRKLQKQFPHAVFVGSLEGEELAEMYASADVFVFPSRTDTFGLVMLEALASGVPVAAYCETGPQDLLEGTQVGVLSGNLQESIQQALALNKENCRDFALKHSWQSSADRFANALVKIENPQRLLGFFLEMRHFSSKF